MMKGKYCLMDTLNNDKVSDKAQVDVTSCGESWSRCEMSKINGLLEAWMKEISFVYLYIYKYELKTEDDEECKR